MALTSSNQSFFFAFMNEPRSLRSESLIELMRRSPPPPLLPGLVPRGVLTAGAGMRGASPVGDDGTDRARGPLSSRIAAARGESSSPPRTDLPSGLVALP
jgi:hypothetical protein